ncbi:signal peptide containing protein [Theileria equi strain WA]|uniref:Signal peptide containing protein n=1 Tax=Theileria equi strain WA TaxID=1537102 RepID=L1LD06_THEEQ|nr:signal peptide containing protein [Theileria equi strain WA]EKX73135.1 signal peptide containing protein [Theileria equi strain WA]|eukprot:XP_004832587.1 signal peptide containing protein [Theileria equi strain WA]
MKLKGPSIILAIVGLQFFTLAMDQETQENDTIEKDISEDVGDDISDDDQEIKCMVHAKRPYGVSPTFTLYGIQHKFSALLIGYDIHTEERRSNKGSLYGWSAPKVPDENGTAKFRFDIDYVSVLPQSGVPLSYCALIFSPPVFPKFDVKDVFGKPAMNMERYFGSKEHLIGAFKRKSRKITECCFVAYPMASRR